MNDYIYEFKDLPSTDTPYNAETFIAMQNKLLDSIYPIGRGFIDFTDTDYSNYLGFTWERELVGLTPIGYNPDDEDFNEIGKTMGEKTHTLTVSEMPKHHHALHLGPGTASSGKAIDYSSQSNYYSYSNFMDEVGGNQPHNNMQPSQVVAYWKRVA